MLGRCAATASDDVHEAFVEEMLHLGLHDGGRLVVAAQGVGQSGIGMRADIIRCFGGQEAQTGQHVVCAERAVESDAQDGGVLYAGEECLECLSAQQSALSVVDRDAEQERDVDGCLLGGLHEGVDGGFGLLQFRSDLLFGEAFFLEASDQFFDVHAWLPF